jgi:hypothetical protein
VPHQPSPNHSVAGINKEPHVAEVAKHQMAAPSQRIHHRVAQRRLSHEDGLEDAPAPCAAMATERSLDGAP